MSKVNYGKRFEQDFSKSAPDWLDVTRLIDAGGWSKSEDLRFTPSNLCDFIVFSEKTHRLYKMELKSVKGISLPFGNINKKKLDKLAEKSGGLLYPCLVINYRQLEKTYMVKAERVKKFMESSPRRSIPATWAQSAGDVIVQTLVRVRYKYDLGWL